MASKVAAIDGPKQAQEIRGPCSNHSNVEKSSAEYSPDVFDFIDIKGFGTINDEKSILALRNLLRSKVTAALAKNRLS